MASRRLSPHHRDNKSPLNAKRLAISQVSVCLDAVTIKLDPRTPTERVEMILGATDKSRTPRGGLARLTPPICRDGGLRFGQQMADVWATWRAPCIERFPHLVELCRENKDRGLTFVSISVDDSKTKGGSFGTRNATHGFVRETWRTRRSGRSVRTGACATISTR